MSTNNKAKAKRIGANRRRHIDTQSAERKKAAGGLAKKWLWIASVAVFAVLAGVAVFKYSATAFVYVSEALRENKKLCTNVTITNCSKAVQASLRQALDSLSADETFLFDRDGAAKAASMVPEIENITIKKVRDRKSRELATQIKVTERKPVALLHNGNFCLVDKKGVRFMATPGQYYDLPLLVLGNAPADSAVDLDVFNKVKNTCRLLGNAFFSQISQIDQSCGEAVNLIFKSGEAEYIIGTDDIEEKLAQVKKLRERLLEEGNGQLARIDMRYHRLAVTSMP